jgi:hypothetical protein
MAIVTDPARELVELCEKIAVESNLIGDEFLADHFRVEPWSKNFFQILFCISERIDFLIEIIKSLDHDEDFKQDAVAHVSAIKGAFRRQALQTPWQMQHGEAGPRFLRREYISALKMLSPQVRQKVSYPKLDRADIDQIKEEVKTLLGWLQEQQLMEHDFIRQTIITGLESFAFRIDRIEWLGWGYTLESLREVIGAYYALQGNIPHDNSAPVAEALLRKVEVLVRNVYEKASIAKDAVETGEFMLKAYGAYNLILPQGISGLLT